MNGYELTLVLPGDLTPAKKKAAQEKIEKIVEVNKGKVGKLNDWGKIDLAYEIKRQSSGNFLNFDLELGSEAVKAVNDKLRVDEGVLRFLLVRTRKSKKN